MAARWRPVGAHRSRGQALVEFSLALIPFVFLLMGVVDFGRAIYIYNGVAQASREIARATSVHVGTDFSSPSGWSTQTNAVVATQKTLVPGLSDSSATIEIACTDVGDNVFTPADPGDPPCNSGQFVRVSVGVKFTVLTPLLGLASPFTFTSASHVQVP